MVTLRIIGLGINNVSHLTLEGVEQLKRAKKILFLSSDPNGLTCLLHQFNIDSIEDLQSLYKDLEQDENNYRNIESKILQDCVDFNDVALLLPGHPQVGVTIVQRLQDRGKQSELNIVMTPGISSFDSMATDLKRDPLEYGSVIVDANRLLLFEYQMEPAIDCYIYHVCSVATSRISMRNPALGNQLNLLQQHLLRFYTPESRVVLICSSIKENIPTQMIDGTVSRLCDLLPHIHFGTTLFIPGRRSESLSKTYLKLLKNN